MRHATLQTLTWGTVSAAVASALWLASFDSGPPDVRAALMQARSVFRLPTEPTAAGTPREVQRAEPAATAASQAPLSPQGL